MFRLRLCIAALLLFGLPGCGEGLDDEGDDLVSEALAEDGMGGLEQTLGARGGAANPGGLLDPGIPGFEEPEPDGVPTEHPICPDCSLVLNLPAGSNTISTISALYRPLNAELNRVVPGFVTVVADKLEIWSSSSFTTKLAEYEINGFYPAAWASVFDQGLTATTINPTPLTAAQRNIANWTNGPGTYRARVRLTIDVSTSLVHTVRYVNLSLCNSNTQACYPAPPMMAQ